MEDIVAAIKLNPNDKQLRAHHAVVKEGLTKYKEDTKKAFGSFFKEGVYNEKIKPGKKDALPKFEAENTQTFMDISIGNDGEPDYATGRVVFEMFNKYAPKTVENFRALCTGEKGELYHYKGNQFHRVISNFMLQGGDTTAGDGTGGVSIYGTKFPDEGVWLPHSHKGILSMANSGKDTNGSQFFVTYKDCPHLDGKHTIFGRVIKGWDICAKAEKVKTAAKDVPL